MPIYKVEIGTVQIDGMSIVTPGVFESDDPSLSSLINAGIISEAGKMNPCRPDEKPILDPSQFDDLSRDEVFRLLELRGVVANPKTPIGALRKMLAKAEATEEG